MNNNASYKILVWSDSIARQHDPVWPEMLRNSFSVSCYAGRKVEVVNIAQCGLPAVIGQTWFEEKVKPENPDLVIVEFGFNDMRHDEAHGGKAIGDPDEYENAVRAMIRNSRSIGARVLVLGIHDFSFGSLKMFPTGLSADETTEIYRSRARQAAVAEGADYIDMADVLDGMGLSPLEYTCDGCHLSENGRRVYVHAVIRYILKNVFEIKKSMGDF